MFQVTLMYFAICNVMIVRSSSVQMKNMFALKLVHCVHSIYPLFLLSISAYVVDSELIPRNASVIVTRVPIGGTSIKSKIV